MATRERLAPRTLDELLEPVRHPLELVERRIARAIDTEEQRLTQSFAALFAGGKRLRPGLALLAAGPQQAASDPVVALGAALEMLHSATLIHDDIIDGAQERRGRPAMTVTLGGDAALLAGDHLFARAAVVVTETCNFEALRVFAQTLVTISGGELGQLWHSDMIPTVDEYLRLIYAKTACLFESAALGGALLAGRSEPEVRRFSEYGRRLGLAFQIADDVLDYVGDRAVMGKPTYSDLRNGHLTLPILLYLRSNPLWRGRRVPDELSDEKVDRLVKAVVAGGFVDKALSMAQGEAEQAWREIEGLTTGAFAESLFGFTAFATSRTS